MRLAAPSWCLQPGRITVMRSLVGWLIRSGGKIRSLYFLYRVTSFGSSCVLRSYPDMMHGWMVRGDMRDQAVNNAAMAAFNALKGFLNTHVK